jgi:hypothetical protein
MATCRGSRASFESFDGSAARTLGPADVSPSANDQGLLELNERGNPADQPVLICSDRPRDGKCFLELAD